MKVILTFTESVLGTLSGNKEIAEQYIIAKHPDGMSKEEIDALVDVPEALQKASTFFSRDEHKHPILWDYQVKGFLKGACSALINTGRWEKEELKKYRLTQYLYKRTIDQQVFVFPRQIPLNLVGDLFFVERPLRAETMKGERIALARSEAAPIGTSIECDILWLNDNLKDWIVEWLNYGALVGIGQWRSGSRGRFSWEDVR